MNIQKRKDKTKFKKTHLYNLTFLKKNDYSIIHQKTLLNTMSLIAITQKKHNPKAAFVKLKTSFTISLGVCLKYLKTNATKALRRDFKHTKYFLNLLKILFFKERRDLIVFSLRGFDYNLLCLRKLLSTFFLKEGLKLFFLFTIKIPFCKTKDKKVKSIKKRLKKKILLDFLEK